MPIKAGEEIQMVLPTSTAEPGHRWEAAAAALLLLPLPSRKSVSPLVPPAALWQNQTHVGSGKEELQEKFWHLSFPWDTAPQPRLSRASSSWSPALYLSAPWDTRTHQTGWRRQFSCQGNMALCTAIVIQSLLSGAANATVQNRVWKPLLSFIVSRLKSFLTTSAENKQLSGYWRVD